MFINPVYHSKIHVMLDIFRTNILEACARCFAKLPKKEFYKRNNNKEKFRNSTLVSKKNKKTFDDQIPLEFEERGKQREQMCFFFFFSRVSPR